MEQGDVAGGKAHLQMMIMENMRTNHGQKDDKKDPEVDGKHLMVKLIMRMR